MGPKSTNDSSKGNTNFSLSESNENSSINSNTWEIYAKLLDWIWNQDDKINNLEVYKNICEQKLSDIDPTIKFPIRLDT